MRVAIVGSRAWPSDKAWDVRARVNDLASKTPNYGFLTIISGGAYGPDTIAVEQAKTMGVETQVYPADWAEYGKSAGYVRNVELVDKADLVIAFWDGKSKGTKHTIDLCLDKHVDLEVHFP